LPEESKGIWPALASVIEISKSSPFQIFRDPHPVAQPFLPARAGGAVLRREY
jgi:hypothetical protein